MEDSINQELWETPKVDKNQLINKEKEESLENKLKQLERTSKFLISKVKTNQVATQYYKQINLILEDILMLELAQQAVETNLQVKTFNSFIQITDKNLTNFKIEMEKIKHLKLVSALLPLASIPIEQENVIYALIENLYGKSKKENKEVSLKDLEHILSEYVETIKNSNNTKNNSNRRTK